MADQKRGAGPIPVDAVKAKPLITIAQARAILGEAAAELSDDDVRARCETIEGLARIIYEDWLRKRRADASQTR